MSIAADLLGIAEHLARERIAAERDRDHARADRLALLVAQTHDCATRVLALEGGPVPSHWRPQRPASLADLDAGAVISLHEARMVRRGLVAP
jgi:hypothetical protein